MTPYLTYLVYRVSHYGDFHYFSPLLIDQLISQAFFYWPPSISRVIFHIIRLSNNTSLDLFGPQGLALW